MFTGIIEELGRAHKLKEEKDIYQYQVHSTPEFVSQIKTGDSISISGVCLTAYAIHKTSFNVDVSVETLRCTTLGSLSRNNRVNLERAVTPSTRLGGHIVNGHVDGIGTLETREDSENESVLWFSVPLSLTKYIAIKGSVCVDGVSLTVNQIEENRYSVTVIPHTLDNTTLGQIRPGDKVNLEVDLIARYLERLMECGR